MPVVVLVVVSPVVGTFVVSAHVLVVVSVVVVVDVVVVKVVVVDVVVEIFGKLPQSYASQGHPFGQFSMHGQLLTSMTSGSAIHF